MFSTHLKRRGLIVVVLGLMAIASYEFTFLAREANAIPAFARKYGFSCNVCHVPSFPKLNDFGNIFRDHGYQLGSDQDLPTYEGITMGYWPVSLRTTVGYQGSSLRVDGSGETSGSFGFTGLDLLSFGILARHVTFGVVYTPGLGSAGFYTGASDSDLEAAFIRLDNLERFIGGKNDTYWSNLRVGKYELDVPFSEKRSPTLNSPFVMYHYVAGTPWQGPLGGLMVNSYGDQNDFMLGENQPGAELAGIVPTPGNSFFRYSLNALSNSNLNTANTGGGRGVNFYGHLTQSFGGYGIVTGQRIGLFGIYGNAPTLANQWCTSPDGPCPGVGGNGQAFRRLGADVSLTFDGQWNLFGAWMYANDSSNLFGGQPSTLGGTISNPQNAAWNGAFVELDWYPYQLPFFESTGWMFIYRYDLIRNIRQGDPSFASNYNDVDSNTFMARYNFHFSPRTDIALHTEYNTFRAKGVGVGGGDQLGQTLLVGFDFAY